MIIADTIGVLNVIAQLIIAIVAIVAILASLRANKNQIESSERQLKEQIAASDKQLNKQIEESRRLATEEHQYQSYPIIVPTKPIPNVPTEQQPGIPQQFLYTSEAPPLK